MPWVSAEYIERVRTGERRICGALDGQHADLWAVVVSDHELVLARQRNQRRDGVCDVMLLDLGVGTLAPLEHGVAAEGDDDPHQPTRVATIAALIVCKWFSAWSKTMEAGDSNTSSATSRASA